MVDNTCGVDKLYPSPAVENKIEKISFQKQSFCDFVALIGRLFYDDACIVLLDFLAHEQHAFSEQDLREKLGWREALIQQKLYLLEKHMIVTQESSTFRGSRPTIYWKINHNIHAAVQFRYQQLVNKLNSMVEIATQQHEFECSAPNCTQGYTALEAACCFRSLDTEHPLCKQCNFPLKPSELESTRIEAREKCSRAMQQLYPLQQSLFRVANMEIPIFQPYSKTEIKQLKNKNLEEHVDSAITPVENSHKEESNLQTNFLIKRPIAQPQLESPAKIPTTIPWFENTKNIPSVKTQSKINFEFPSNKSAFNEYNISPISQNNKQTISFTQLQRFSTQ